MKKVYITPELEAIKISAVSLLADSLDKSSTPVTDENDVLVPGLVIDEF